MSEEKSSYCDSNPKESCRVANVSVVIDASAIREIEKIFVPAASYNKMEKRAETAARYAVELESEVKRLQAAEKVARDLAALVEQVEWVINPHEYSVCAWCGGEERDFPAPDAQDFADEIDYECALERWNRFGHKPDCQRQAVLAAFYALFGEDISTVAVCREKGGEE